MNVMNYRPLILLSVLIYMVAVDANAGSAIDSLMQEYSQQGVARADAEAGEHLWNQDNISDGDSRRCSTCHGTDPRQTGKHVRTGKAIEPMAPSVNPERLTDIDKINKWFTRNCKWTLGRECSAQEKADVLAYLKNL